MRVRNKLITMFYSVCLIFLLLFICNDLVIGQEQKEFNPADPTQAATSLIFMPEYNKAPDYKAYGLRTTLDVDWDEGIYSVNVEAAYGKAEYTDGVTETGITDTRTRFFWKFYENQESSLQNMIFSLDVFLPTGNASKGFGAGTFMFVPGVIFAFPISESFAIYPNPRIQFTSGKTTARTSAFPPGRNALGSQRESEQYIFAFELETFFIYYITSSFWVFADPIFNWDFLPEPNEDNYELTMRNQIGKMFGYWGLGLESTIYLAGEKSQDLQARLVVFYFF